MPASGRRGVVWEGPLAISSLPLPRVVVVSRAGFEIAQGREPPGRAGRMQRFALAARLRADDPQHLFPVVLATEDASGVRPGGALDPEGPGRGGGSNRRLLRSSSRVEGADPKPLALEVQPDRLAADRDQPLRAVDLAAALGAGSVFGAVVVVVFGDVAGLVRSGVFGGIRPILFFFPRKPRFKPDTPDTINVFNGLARILNPTQRGLVSGWILAKSPLFSTLCRVCRVQKPDSGPQKNRTLFRSRLAGGR